MSLLRVLRGAVNVEASFGRPRREVHSGIVDINSTSDVHVFTPLEEYLSKHGVVKALVPLSTLIPSCRKDFYDHVAIDYIKKGGESLACILQPNMSHVGSV